MGIDHDKLKEQVDKYRQEIKSDRMDMSFGEIINMYKENEIIITPEYQRAFRWDKQRQTNFIESILLGMPFPSIFVATNDDGKWELIDGLQRISTVLSFFGELKDNSKNNLVLEEGSLVNKLKDLDVNTIPLEYKLQIKRTPCRIEIIQKESEFGMRYELFKRLNTGGEGLSRQEIRNCIFRGLDNSFNATIKEMSKYNNFRDIVIINEDEAAKMYYEELVLRFLTLKNDGTQYKESTIQEYMDKYMKKMSENPNRDQINKDKQIFFSIIDFLKSLQKSDIFKLSRQNFTTSMYDALMLSLASQIESLIQLNKEIISEKIDTLKNDNKFTKYTGSASSNPTNITNKVQVANRVLFGNSQRKK